MQRRSFLRGMLAMAAVASTASVTQVIAAPNKYRESLRLLDSSVQAQGNAALCNQRFNELLVYLHSNFDAPPVSDENALALRGVLRNYSLEGIRGIPPTVADDIYPVALTKLALAHYKLPLDPDALGEFDNFHKRYGKLVMKATER